MYEYENYFKMRCKNFCILNHFFVNDISVKSSTVNFMFSFAVELIQYFINLPAKNYMHYRLTLGST